MRSTFGRATIAAMLALLAVPETSSAQTIDGPAVAWTFSTWGKARAFTVGMETVAKLVKEKTGGKFDITIRYGEAPSKERDGLDGIKLGSFQGAHFCNFHNPGKNPAWMVYALPFLPLSNWDVSQKVRSAMLKHPALVADMARWNAVSYKSELMPQYEFLGKGAPPTTIEGWKGKRVRAGGGIGSAMVILGATLSAIPADDVYAAMQRNTVDAASFPFTSAHATYKTHEVSTWFTSNMSPATSECAAVFNRDALKALPPQYQKLLDEVLPEAYKTQIEAYKAIDAKNLALFKTTLKEIVYPAAELARFQKLAGQPVRDKWVKDNQSRFNARGVLDALGAEIRKARGT